MVKALFYLATLLLISAAAPAALAADEDPLQDFCVALNASEQQQLLGSPHVHPLAQGTLLVGFVSTAPANKFFYQTIHAGDLFVFPRGLVHFQFNPHMSKPAMAIAALNSQNPGASQVATALFAANPPLPDDALETTLGVDSNELHHLISSVQRTLM